MKSDAEYKELSIREFTKAAEIYDSGHAGIYEMCKDDYPPILEELEKEPFSDLLDVGCGTGPMIELLTEVWRRSTGNIPKRRNDGAAVVSKRTVS